MYMYVYMYMYMHMYMHMYMYMFGPFGFALAFGTPQNHHNQLNLEKSNIGDASGLHFSLWEAIS